MEVTGDDRLPQLDESVAVLISQLCVAKYLRVILPRSHFEHCSSLKLCSMPDGYPAPRVVWCRSALRCYGATAGPPCRLSEWCDLEAQVELLPGVVAGDDWHFPDQSSSDTTTIGQ